MAALQLYCLLITVLSISLATVSALCSLAGGSGGLQTS